MRMTKQLRDLLAEDGGLLRTARAESIGLTRPSIMKFVRTQGLERIARGVYASPDAWVDDMYVLSLRSERAVFSHESALLLHNLAEREPDKLTVTLPSGYNASSLRRNGIQTYFIKPELLPLGITSLVTPEGNQVPSYDLERTICDLVRSRSHIDNQTLTSALKSYVRRPDKQLSVLADYANQLGVIKLMRSYLEVLL